MPREHDEDGVKQRDRQKNKRVRVREPVDLVYKDEHRKADGDRIGPQAIAEEIVRKKSVDDAVRQEIERDKSVGAVRERTQVLVHKMRATLKIGERARPHGKKEDGTQGLPRGIERLERHAKFKQVMPDGLFADAHSWCLYYSMCAHVPIVPHAPVVKWI